MVFYIVNLSQILHSFPWRFGKYKFHVTVMVAVTCFEVWVETAAVRESTALTQDLPIADGSLSQDRWGTFTSRDRE